MSQGQGTLEGVIEKELTMLSRSTLPARPRRLATMK